MKGYLRRLVSPSASEGAIAPLHPMVGSLALTRDRKGFEEETLLAPAPRTQPAASAIVSAPLRSPLPPQPELTSAPHTRESGEEASPRPEAAFSSFQPLVRPIDREPASVPRPGKASRPSQEGAMGVPRETPAAAFTSQNVPQELVHLFDAPSSELPPATQWSPARAPERLPTPPGPVNEGSHVAPLVRRAAATAAIEVPPQPPQPDEIHINIGRIELTAVPAQSPRPAAQLRKSLSLDEYLSRRNGRGR